MKKDYRQHWRFQELYRSWDNDMKDWYNSTEEWFQKEYAKRICSIRFNREHRNKVMCCAVLMMLGFSVLLLIAGCICTIFA